MAIRAKLSLSDRLYWAKRNWSAALLWVPAAPFYIVARILCGVWEVFRMLFITNGSEVLAYPWEQKWIGDEE